MKASFCVSALLVVSLCVYFVPAPTCASSVDPPPHVDGKEQPPDVAGLAIPGPLRSFLRMAGISQKVRPEEVAALLARNVFLRGFQGSRETEFLILLNRYVQQARELAVLAGQEGVLHASTCDDAKPLLKILGYRTRPDCGKHGSYLETADPQRAFITIDSGFPLPALEKSLEDGRAFAYPYPISRVPALRIESEWTKKGDSKDFLDMLLRDPFLGRFYWALARMDAETQEALRQSPAFRKMIPFAPVLDFYGTHIRIRAGRVIVPGGEAGEAGWKDLVGASPQAPGEFVLRLISKDNGWLAAYFESLSRISQGQQMHFNEPRQLRRCYEALRGRDTSPNATAGVFRPDSGLVLLAARLKWQPNGNPRIPGNLEVWKQILRQKSDYKLIRQLGRQSKWWHQDSQLLEALFAMSRLQTEAHPLQAYLMLSELDDKRPRERRLRPETVSMLAGKFRDFSDQYLVFSEFPDLDDSSIVAFLNTASSLTSISNNSLRGNALGTFQAILGLWQIWARQNEIPSSNLNDSWRNVIKSFENITSPVQLFDAGRTSLAELLRVVTGKPAASQDRIIDFLAGPHQSSPEGQAMHEQVANRIRSVLDEQRLVSLDTILTLGDGLHDLKHVRSAADALIPLAQELRGFEMPQPIFRNSERDQWAGGIYNNHHTELQMRTDLVKIIKAPKSSEQLALARGQLAPFLRDTLVGLNYAYYEPPGAQILHHNPLFVRSHDFSGETIGGLERVWQAPRLFGVGSPAGGGAHLVGSLADLPYVLSTTEQEFIAPENVQALIWQEVVPGLLINAIVPRWWGISRNELHAVTLYQQAGEELLAASVQNEELRNNVIQILSGRMLPQSSERVERALRTGHLPELLPQLMPADTFYLAAEYRQKFPDRADSFGPAGKELAALVEQYPAEVSWQRLSKDFGVPHPTFAQSYARELLNLAPFPAFAGYSSRLLAESWDSNNLFWARLADEKGYSPVMLNRLVPELTHRMIEKIFATDLEDWPALLRAERDTGDEFRQGKIASLNIVGIPSSQQ